MAACDDETNNYKEARNDVNDLRGEIKDLQREQFTNYKTYWTEIAAAYGEGLALGLFAEGLLGAVLGAVGGGIGTTVTEANIDETHDEIDNLKDELEDADAKASDAEEALCACLIEHGEED